MGVHVLDNRKQAGVASGASVRLRESYRQVNGGVVGNFEPQNLCRAEQQDRFGTRRVGWKSLFKKPANQVTQSAESSQHRRSEPSRQGSIPVSERGQARMCVFA